jgi:DUF1680 family protein
VNSNTVNSINTSDKLSSGFTDKFEKAYASSMTLSLTRKWKEEGNLEVHVRMIITEVVEKKRERKGKGRLIAEKGTRGHVRR